MDPTRDQALLRAALQVLGPRLAEQAGLRQLREGIDGGLHLAGCPVEVLTRRYLKVNLDHALAQGRFTCRYCHHTAVHGPPPQMVTSGRATRQWSLDVALSAACAVVALREGPLAAGDPLRARLGLEDWLVDRLATTVTRWAHGSPHRPHGPPWQGDEQALHRERRLLLEQLAVACHAQRAMLAASDPASLWVGWLGDEVLDADHACYQLPAHGRIGHRGAREMLDAANRRLAEVEPVTVVVLEAPGRAGPPERRASAAWRAAVPADASGPGWVVGRVPWSVLDHGGLRCPAAQLERRGLLMAPLGQDVDTADREQVATLVEVAAQLLGDGEMDAPDAVATARALTGLGAHIDQLSGRPATPGSAPR